MQSMHQAHGRSSLGSVLHIVRLPQVHRDESSAKQQILVFAQLPQHGIYDP